MKNFYASILSPMRRNFKIHCVLAFTAILAQAQSAFGQVAMTTTGSYTQNFDALPVANGTWADNSMIANWYSQRTGTGTGIVADNGSGTAGTLYSYGTTAATERALGTLGSGNPAAGNFAHGLLLRNTSGGTITDISVAYTLEEWRVANATAQPLTVWYKISSTAITSLTPNNNTGWTQVTALTANSPINSATAASLNGNLAANRVVVSSTALTGLSLANNSYIMLKWEDPDHASTDNGLSIDDVAINWTTPPACNTSSTINATECDSYTLNASTYTTSGTYEQHLNNAGGCDSTITLNLVINSSYEAPRTASICTGSSYTFGTQTLTAAGTYDETFQRAGTGCDSLIHLTLSVISAFNETDAVSICSGDAYTFGTQTLTTAGEYTEHFTSQSSCDSVVVLTLTVNQPSDSTLTVVSCTPTYNFHGNTYASAGTYFATVENAAGCDSIITLNLSFGTPNSFAFSADACGSYVWNTQTYNASGTYTQHLTNLTGCDSTVTLTLSIAAIPSTPVTSADTNYCGNQLPVAMTAGSTPSAPLIISGIADAQLPGGLPKCVELYVIEDIADLSIYGVASANNGAGPNAAPELVFPAISATAGSYIRIATDSLNFFNFYGFYPEYKNDVSNINGDDAIELFQSGVVIDVFGQVSQDGTGLPWEYTDGWAYRNAGSVPNNGNWNINEWTFSGISVFVNVTQNALANPAFPISTFTTTTSEGDYTWYSDEALTDSIGAGATFMPSVTPGNTSYYVVQTVNDCVSTPAEVVIGMHAASAVPVITAGSALTFCAGGEVVLTSSAANNVWSTEATSSSIVVTASGNYTVTAADANGCEATSAAVEVVVNPAPVATAVTTDHAMINASPVNLVFDYQWINCAGNTPVAGATAATFTPATDGSYAVIVMNGAGCADTSNCVAIDVLGLNENKAEAGISLYPNPTNGKVTLTMQASEPVQVTVFNALGKVVATMSNVQSGAVIDLGSVQNGVYMVQVANPQISKVYRIVKK